MQKSIARDEDDLNFQQRKIDSSDGQLEAQIRQAKIKMTKERIRSKNEKLAEMFQTKTELEKRIASQKEKESKRQKQGEIAAAKAAAKEKIAQKIAATALARKDEDGKLEKAAEAIGMKKEAAATEEVAPATEEVKVEATTETPEAETVVSEAVAVEAEATVEESKDDLDQIVANGAAITKIINEEKEG